MHLGKTNEKVKKALTLAMITTMVGTQLITNTDIVNALTNKDSISINKIGQYKAGDANKDGGVAEIVTYNKENNKMYTISGTDKKIHVVDMSTLEKNKSTELKSTKIINVEEEIKKFDDSFKYGDITSIDINYEKKIVVATVQHEDYNTNGKIIIMNYDGEIQEVFECGVQPDMVKISSDGKYILTADEGEPREGYGENVIDPEGSVTILNYETKETKTVKFDDSQLEGKVLIRNKEGGAKVDLEPEYISLSTNGKTAYVALQENNAIATIDIESGNVKSVKSLGFKDYSVSGNELDAAKDGQINIEDLPILGAYMPDGITNINIGGVEYILTANEGDGTEWAEGTENEVKNIAKLKKINVNELDIQEDTYAGFSKEEATEKIKEMASTKGYEDLEVLTDVDNEAIYILGGRSFSIRRADTMEIVFDSGADFENIISERYPEYFNVSNSKIEMDARSTKKGPEPEYVEVGKIGDKVYAFVGIERQGGIMTYDITNPSQAKFINYYNTRDYSSDIAGDSGPEGLKFIFSQDNPTNQDLLLVANEVSGTVAVNQIGENQVVEDENQIENEKPIINAKDITIKVGDKFNPLEGVTASDKEDGDLTDSIKVTKNTVNTNVAGKYEVTYEVSDSNNQKSTKTINITVEELAPSGDESIKDETQSTPQGTGSNNNNPSTGDAGIMGYVAAAGASLGTLLFVSKRKRK